MLPIKINTKGTYFLCIPHVTSKIKQLLPIDDLSISEVEYSTFLGTENDDMLLRLKNRRENLGFIFFSGRGQLRKVNDSEIPYHEKEMLAKFSVS